MYVGCRFEPLVIISVSYLNICVNICVDFSFNISVNICVNISFHITLQSTLMSTLVFHISARIKVTRMSEIFSCPIYIHIFQYVSY